MNDLAQQICEEAKRLPEPLAREVLSFIQFVEFKNKVSNQQTDELMKSQETVMNSIWNNIEDEVWNDI